MSKIKNYFSVPEAARELRVSLRWIYDLVRSGKMAATKDCGRWKIPIEEIKKRSARRWE